ncbi:MAG: phenylalanine--tRNA ligase subunit alpha [Anaerolineae bacterium]|nr:phenylalanine--tRNA ligase subunit alpha [Anaerolineae bacterium]
MIAEHPPNRGLQDLQELRVEAEESLAAVNNREELQAWHNAYLGRRGSVTRLLRRLGELPPAQRPAAGRQANTLKVALEAAYEIQREALARRERESAGEVRSRDRLDVTLPGRPVAQGGLHPITQTLREMKAAFARMGFQVYEGPEVELDRYNFTLLNMPPYHPARELHDTFYTTLPGLLLRTHTSPNQVRLMERLRPPIRIVVPGKVYRYENADPSHDWMFYQMEGLVVGKGITMCDLMGTIRELARQIFGPDRRIRFRCDYFPYVEPGLDTAVSCMLCQGTGCRLCGGTGWLEAIPGGMVHPQVLRSCGIDPEEHTGFAFGAGPDRIAALKHGIDDIRRFYANDLRFLEQF